MLCYVLITLFLDSSLLKIEKEGEEEWKKDGNSTDCFSAIPIMNSLWTGGHCAPCNTDEGYGHNKF